MANRSVTIRLLRGLATVAAVLGIVAASVVGLDDWADGISTQGAAVGAGQRQSPTVE
jgi:hypothetical protein